MEQKSYKFGSRRHMLQTIHNMYLYVLDNAADGSGNTSGNLRLSYDKQKELGRNLAQYWDIKK